MNTREIFLRCCQAHQWSPLYINDGGSAELDSISIDAEAKEALRKGDTTLCLALIDLAKTFDLQSVVQLELKAAALQQLRTNKPSEEHETTAADGSPEMLINRLLQTCQEQQWTPQFLKADTTTTEKWVVEQAILKEAEAARNADRPDLSLNLINTTLETGFHSLWLHHLKAQALHKLEQFEEAVHIWEKLSTQDIEGFSDNVRSALKAAKVDQALAKARQLDTSGDLDAAIASLTSALLSDPDQKEVETSLKAMLRKRRHGGTAAAESSPLEDHQDELDLNQAFLSQAQNLLDGREALQEPG